MLLLTVPTLPENCVVETAYSLVYANHRIEISNKGFLRNLIEPKNTDEFAVAFELLAKFAPPEANAIIGIQVSTSTQHFSDGTFMYLTLVGTPVQYVMR
jgi:regulator of nucleoside diphosphate kinase